MDKQNYENLVQNLANATRVQDAPPPVLDDQINFLKETGKSVLEVLGGGLASKSVEGGIKKLRSVAPEVEEAVGEGESDASSLATSIIKGGVRAGKRIVKKAVNDGIKNLKTPIQEAVGDASQESTAGLEGMQSVLNRGLGQTVEDELPQLATEDASADASAASSLFSASPASSAVSEAAEESAETAASTASKAAEIGDKASEVVSDIDKATKASAEADEFDPEGLLITGALGLAGIISGLFVKTRRTVNITPKFVPSQLNYSTQAGVQ